MTIEESKEIVVSDFNNCFEQMRHYDSQISEYFKFTVSLYLTILGGIIAVFGINEIEVDSVFPFIKLILLFIGIIGIVILIFITKNRVYFVKMARYINEQRKNAYEKSDFKNQSLIYYDQKKPKYYEIFSSQILLIYILSMLNSISLVIAIGDYICLKTSFYVLTIIILFIIQSLFVYLYFRKKET